jgi:hypothetical protein
MQLPYDAQHFYMTLDISIGKMMYSLQKFACRVIYLFIYLL